MFTKMKPVTQEHLMSCGVACVAFAAQTSYKNAMKKFNEKHASNRGYYLKDMVEGLKKLGLEYEYKKANKNDKNLIKKEGVIVFIRRSEKYPGGHYLIKSKEGWMNPWINYPLINPVKSGFNKKIPGEVQWILFPKGIN